MKFSVAHAAGSASFWQALETQDTITVEQAIQQSKLLSEFPALDISKLKVGIFGKACKSSQVIEEGDRVEVYLPTLVQEPDDDDDY